MNLLGRQCNRRPGRRESSRGRQKTHSLPTVHTNSLLQWLLSLEARGIFGCLGSNAPTTPVICPMDAGCQNAVGAATQYGACGMERSGRVTTLGVVRNRRIHSRCFAGAELMLWPKHECRDDGWFAHLSALRNGANPVNLYRVLRTRQAWRRIKTLASTDVFPGLFCSQLLQGWCGNREAACATSRKCAIPKHAVTLSR